MKKIISIILCICIMSGVIPVSVYANEIEKGYLRVSINNIEERYECLVSNGKVYCLAEDLAKMTFYQYAEMENGLEYDFFREFGSEPENYRIELQTQVNVKINKDKSIAEIKSMHETYTMTCFYENEKLFLPVEELLVLLHAQWIIENKIIYISPMPYNILDFMAMYHDDIAKMASSSEDALIDTGWLFSTTKEGQAVYCVIAEVLKDFDGSMFMLWWPEKGHVKTEEYYEKAILQLAKSDAEILGEETYSEIVEKAMGYMGEMVKTVDEAIKPLQQIGGLLGNTKDVIEDIPEAVSLLQKLHQKFPEFVLPKSLENFSDGVKNGTIDLSLFEIPELDARVRELSVIGDALSITKVVCDICDICQRSKNKDPEYIAQLEILAHYENPGYVSELVSKYTRTAAKKLLGAYSKPTEYKVEEGTKRVMEFFTQTLFEQTDFGKIKSLLEGGQFIYGSFDKKSAETWDVYKELAKVTYSIKLEQLVGELFWHESILTTDNKLTANDIEEFRNQMMMFLKLNLRNKGQLYKLNEKGNKDDNWIYSKEAEDLRGEMANVEALILVLEETKNSDVNIIVNRNSVDHIRYERIIAEKGQSVQETTPVEEEQKKAVKVKYEHFYTDESEEYGIITGVDENEETIWQFETAKNPAAQLDSVQEIGTREDKYYFESSEGIFAVRISDGSVVWKNTDGRGDHYCFDADGNLYLCGMLGPHFLAIDVNGNTLCKIDKLDESHYWPYDLQWEGEKVTMKFDGVPEGEKPGVVCEINLNDYSYQFLNGTSGMNQADINGAVTDNVTEEPAAEVTDYNQLWTNFIKEKGYASYVGEWPVPVRDYCILDIDQNGISEMVLCSDDMGGGFAQCQLYSVNNGNIVVAAEFTTCYGFVYSPEYHALAYRDHRCSVGHLITKYMQFDGSQYYEYMNLCEDVDASTGNAIYTEVINGQSREISEGEYRRILSESVQNPEVILVN